MSERSADEAGKSWVASASGLLAVALNLAGVLVLWPVPSAYKPDRIAQWAVELAAAPSASTASAVCFTVGVLALLPALTPLLRAEPRPGGAGTQACALIGAGALLNGAATLAPIVALKVGDLAVDAASARPVVHALLLWTLAADALFNLCLGVGLLRIGVSSADALLLPRWLRFASLAAGVLVLPVSLQLFSAAAAAWLAIGGSAWLLYFTAFSVWTALSAVQGANTRRRQIAAPVA